MRVRGIGVCFIVLSILISLTNVSFTGAVVGVGLYGFLNLVAVAFFLAGIVMLFASGTLEQVADSSAISPGELMERVDNVGPHGDKVVVADTSALGVYTKRGICVLMDGLSEKYGGAVIPGSVLRELRGPVADLRDPVLKRSVPPFDNYKLFLGEARECLETSRKAFYHHEIIPIILGEKEAPSSRREAAPYIAAVKKLMRDIFSSGKALNRRNLVGESERHWKVSDTDVDVLAAAMAEASRGRDAILVERDVDFKYAVGALRRKNPKLGFRVHLVDTYKA